MSEWNESDTIQNDDNWSVASGGDANVNNIKLGRALDAMIPIVAEVIYIF